MKLLKGCLSLIVILVALIVIIGACTGGESEDTSKEQESSKVEEEKVEEVEEEVKEEVEVSLNITPKEFEERMNATGILDLDSIPTINVIVEEGSAQNVFQQAISDSVSILGTVRKSNGMVRDVSVVGGGFNESNDAMNYMLLVGSVISSVSPELTADERGSLLMEKLRFEDVVSMNVDKTEYVLNGVKYSISFEDGLGVLMFNAKNELD